MNGKYKEWLEYQSEIEKAEKWNNLPQVESVDGSNFAISRQCSKKPVLVRVGQQRGGGRHHWETSDVFGGAILGYIISNWDDHYPKIIDYMKNKSDEMLQDLQAYVDELQKLISENL